MVKVIDIATKMVIAARPEMAIYDAIRLMVSRNITGLPVVDAELNLVGILSEKDVLKLLYEKLDRTNLTVADYMSTEVISLDENAAMTDLCDCIVDGNLRIVPITSDDKLCAIADRSDVIRAILMIKNQVL